MSITTVRLTLIEQAVAKLAAAKGPRVSAMMREARQRAMAGEAPPPVLHTSEDLERQARGTGVTAAMARAAIRVAQGVPRDVLLPATVAPQDVDLGGAGLFQGRQGRSTAPAMAVVSEREALLQRLDATLARAGGHV